MNNIASEFDGLAGANLASLTGFQLAVNTDEPLTNNFLPFAAGHDEVDGFK